MFMVGRKACQHQATNGRLRWPYCTAGQSSRRSVGSFAAQPRRWYSVQKACVYIEDVDINIRNHTMPLQIANPTVVAKVDQLAKAMGMTKTAVVERAIDRLAGETQAARDPGRMAAILAQLDRIPSRADAFDPLQWDAQGLPT